MKKNGYTNTMNKKTNNELEIILEQKNNYNDQAIQAVIWELEERGVLEKTAEIIIDETPLEQEIIAENTPSKIEEEAQSPFENLELPALYSQKTIQGFTIFFTTIFGAVLLMANLKKMNKPKARIQVLAFGIVYTLSTIILLNYLPRMFFITLLFNLVGYLILMGFFWNKNFEPNLEYRKKKIWKPLIISILITIALVFLQFLPQILGEQV